MQLTCNINHVLSFPDVLYLHWSCCVLSFYLKLESCSHVGWGGFNCRNELGLQLGLTASGGKGVCVSDCSHCRHELGLQLGLTTFGAVWLQSLQTCRHELGLQWNWSAVTAVGPPPPISLPLRHSVRSTGWPLVWFTSKTQEYVTNTKTFFLAYFHYWLRWSLLFSSGFIFWEYSGFE